MSMPNALITPTKKALSTLQTIGKLEDIVVLGMRLWIANIFWKSGLTKLSSWETTVALFADEYKTPFLSPELAGTLSTYAELSMPVLLLVGLGSRGAAVVLLVMTAVIEFTYMHFEIHKIWALVLLLIIIKGPGKLSLDYLVRRWAEYGVKSRKSL